jgi:hypothetical protein
MGVVGVHSVGHFFLLQQIRVAADFGFEVALDTVTAEEIANCCECFFHRLHSWRSATMGSMRMARRAGIQHETAVTIKSNAMANVSVNGSLALMP